MTPEAINAWFTPFAYIVYLGSLLFGMIGYYQWKWSKVCKMKVLVLVQRADGHGDFELADSSGGQVTLVNPRTKTNQVWPINELATIAVPYPGVGFVPLFLQKTIRMVIVREDDWEPMTNRSRDMEMIASPAILGNLFLEKIMEAVITVNKEMLEDVQKLVTRLGSRVSPTMFYIGIGVVLVVLVFLAFQILPIASSLETIEKALGVVGQ